MKKFIFRLALIFSGVVVFSGCSIFPKNPDVAANYFDIGAPQKNKSVKMAGSIEVKDFKTTGPYNERMVFRTSETHLEFDEYNRWACSPEEMLKNYFTLALGPDEANGIKLRDDNLQLLAKILRLEADLTKKTVRLVLLAQIVRQSSNVSVYSEILAEEEKIDRVTAEKFAETLKILADRIIARIANDISMLGEPSQESARKLRL